MADRRADFCNRSAAYLYVLRPAELALAWHDLYRDPDHRSDRLQRRHRPGVAHPWGLRIISGCALVSSLVPDHHTVLQLCSDADPQPMPTHSSQAHLWQQASPYDGIGLIMLAQWLETLRGTRTGTGAAHSSIESP